jgi:hypothetical protein
MHQLQKPCDCCATLKSQSRKLKKTQARKAGSSPPLRGSFGMTSFTRRAPFGAPLIVSSRDHLELMIVELDLRRNDQISATCVETLHPGL